MAVRNGGFGALKPIPTLVAIGRREVTVLWNGLYACWVLAKGRDSVRYGRSNFSKILIIGERKEIGW
jgi:hypothetical protein